MTNDYIFINQKFEAFEVNRLPFSIEILKSGLESIELLIALKYADKT